MSRMLASFVETFVAAEGDSVDFVFENEIQAPSAYVSGAVGAAEVKASDKLCVGSVCVDTVAFGKMLRTSVLVQSLAMQTLAMEVFMVNSMIGFTTLLPNQSVVSLTYVGGDYGKMTSTDPSGLTTSEFATAVASAVNQALIGSSPRFSTSASATASFINSLDQYPVPVSFVGTNGITGVTGEDVTNQVAAHLAVFATWSDAMSTSGPSSASAASTSSSSSSTNSGVSVYPISVTEGSIVVNLLITYHNLFS